MIQTVKTAHRPFLSQPTITRLLVGLVVVLSFVLSAACVSAAPETKADATTVGGPRLTFDKNEHDFGRVSAAQLIEYPFAFTNTGTEPLQIGEIYLEPVKLGG